VQGTRNRRRMKVKRKREGKKESRVVTTKGSVARKKKKRKRKSKTGWQGCKGKNPLLMENIHGEKEGREGYRGRNDTKSKEKKARRGENSHSSGVEPRQKLGGEAKENSG